MAKNETITPEWMADPRVAEYLDITIMTMWRLDNLPQYAHLNFPKPAVINGRKHRSRKELDAFMRARVADGIKAREERAEKRKQRKSKEVA